MMKRLLPLVAALAMSLVATPAIAAEPYSPQEGALFNDPYRDFDKKWILMRHVQDTIDAVVGPDEEILLTTFLLDRRVIVDKLLAARDRGVSVRVIFDSEIVEADATRLENGLNADNLGAITTDPASWGPDDSYVKRCVGSCRGAGGNMHSKFYMFSKAGGVDNIVMVSSANLNAGGALRGYNDLYTITERQATYDRYSQLHLEMTQDSKLDDSYATFTDGVFEHRFFPMRNATEQTDPVMVDLSQVRCSGATETVDGKTALHVSMFYWDGARGVYIRDRLLELADAGCNVNIVYGAPSKTVAPKLKRYAEQSRIKLWDSRHHTDDDGLVDIRVHSKYMLVNGRFGADRSVQRVFTGSQNWVGGSLTRGDETMLVIDDPGAYAAYLDNWTKVVNAEQSTQIHP